jgi:hypothetical protein
VISAAIASTARPARERALWRVGDGRNKRWVRRRLRSHGGDAGGLLSGVRRSAIVVRPGRPADGGRRHEDNAGTGWASRWPGAGERMGERPSRGAIASPLERRHRCLVRILGSDSPVRASKILTATSSTTGVEPVSSNRAQACLNARFVGSRRSSSLNFASPARPVAVGMPCSDLPQRQNDKARLRECDFQSRGCTESDREATRRRAVMMLRASVP